MARSKISILGAGLAALTVVMLTQHHAANAQEAQLPHEKMNLPPYKGIGPWVAYLNTNDLDSRRKPITDGDETKIKDLVAKLNEPLPAGSKIYYVADELPKESATPLPPDPVEQEPKKPSNPVLVGPLPKPVVKNVEYWIEIRCKNKTGVWGEWETLIVGKSLAKAGPHATEEDANRSIRLWELDREERLAIKRRDHPEQNWRKMPTEFRLQPKER